MGNDLLPENRGNQGIGPQRTKRPGNRFQPYNAGHIPRQNPPGNSNPELETPQLPRQSESDSESLPELDDIDEGYDSDQVETYDVAWNQKATATANASDYEKWDTASAEFIRSYSGLGSGWVGKRPLGAGGFGMAGLWEKYDGNGTVIEQMVIKQIGVRKGIWRPEMPMEVKMMKKMEETECPSVVRYRAYRRFLHDQVHRIYMEYCPYGDLKRLYKRYKSLVFLDTEDRKSGIPFYPTAKLGDWGLARLTHANDPDNPSNLRKAGTPGYKPPEQNDPPLPIFESHPSSILAHTNVWAIGATMFELMTLHRVHGFLLKPRGNIINEEGIKPIQTNREPPYSLQLSKLIQDCLKSIPLDRPNVTELRAKISTHRDAIVTLAREREEAETAKPSEDERLYYIVTRSSGPRQEIGNRMNAIGIRISQQMVLQTLTFLPYGI